MGYENSGRRPIPTALKMLRGNPGLRRLNLQEPLPPAEGPVVKPETLSAGASGVWDAVAPVCLAMRTLTAADVQAFRTLCELQASFDEVVKLKGSDDFKLNHELVLADKLRPYYEYFGMTPSSRARIHVPKQNTAEPVSKWAGVLK